MVRLKEEECQVVITGLEETGISVEVFAEASFGNVEGGKTKIGFYMRLR